ncbi:MAG: di-trans,poly-cis-decaprenylcistransferase [Bacteroidales bacterium]|nr:di-trans,poly-cis-decaprenylcistransferase [Bacteroidales bacterium]
MHVAIIMDGNGRWARERGLERVDGHREGAESVRACIEAAVEDKIDQLSLFAFSEENWGRPADEVGTLMKLMMKSIAEETENLLSHDVRFRVLGDLGKVPPLLRSAIATLEDVTSSCKGLQLNIFLSYSGRWDILQAAKRFAASEKEPESASAADFAKYLVTDGIPEPDLLIRTSGEQRISNFLLWQCAYTEFYFTPVLWPDFRKPEFREAVREFAHRHRRYGLVE